RCSGSSNGTAASRPARISSTSPARRLNVTKGCCPTDRRQQHISGERMSQPNVVVLGSGMAGLGATHRLHADGITPIIYDTNYYHGGHTASFRSESGFLFDLGPHISYTNDPRIQELMVDSVELN